MNNKYNTLKNCFIIIYMIDNNLTLFIDSYKIDLIKNLKEINSNDPLFILNLNNKDLKIFCNKIILKLIN